MAFIHGKDTEVTLNASDLTTFTRNSQFSREVDSHDDTTYGKEAHSFHGGLKNGTVTLEGVYDNGATGPHDVIPPLLGTRVDFVRRPEGSGTGLPVETVEVLVQSYQESAPVADLVTWSATLQMCEPVADTNQP